MDEVYTCKCGNQAFSIHDGFIRCSQCRKEYKLRIIESSLNSVISTYLESPEDFNERIKKEA